MHPFVPVSSPARWSAGRAGRRLVLGLACWLGAPALPAARAAETLARDPQLHFTQLLAAALARAPESLERAPRREEAARHEAAGRAWLAGTPSLETTYLDDRLKAARGVSELEYGVQLPLWRPGERGIAARLGGNLGRQAEAWQEHLRWTVAGRLRLCLTELDGAERLLALEREATAEAERLLTTVERLAAAGESAAAEVAQARSLLLQQRREESGAATALAKARAEYGELTGLAARPDEAHREEAARHDDLGAEHPWLRYLASGVAVARDTVARTNLEERGRPSVLLGARRQRDGQGAARDDAFALGLSLPFGGRPHTAARVSTARRGEAEAAASLESARLELARQLRELRLDATHVETALRLSAEQVALDRRHVTAARVAFETGEFNLFQVLTAIRQARVSTREHEQLLLRRTALAAQINQTLGLLP